MDILESSALKLATCLLVLLLLQAGDASHLHYHGDVKNHEKYVSYSELSEYTDKFMMSSVKGFSEFYFDPAGFQVVVGARDYLFRFSLKGLHLLESAEWSPDSTTSALCDVKGQSQESCRNYIKLLHMVDGRLLACGTNAFSPKCSWRSLSEINSVKYEESGIGRSPFNPDHSITSLATADGGLYVGTSTDFMATDSAFIRFKSRSLRTKAYDSNWLSEPKFVSSFEASGFVYFFFRENAVENMNCGKRIFSRIGRVCKNDPGGSMKLKGTWTTFLKARLNCSLPGEYPLYYDDLQSVAYISEQIVYGVFATQQNSLRGSAICAFNMTAITNSFNGPFKYQSSSSAAWGPVTVAKPNFKCENSSEGPGTKASVMAADKYQLMDEAVKPVSPQPVFTLDYQKLGLIAIDVVTTRQSGEVHVLYVAAEDNTIRKLSVIPPDGNGGPSTTCLLEILQPVPSNSSNRILNLQFLEETTSLYIGTDNEVLRVPVDRCDRYKTRLSCLKAKDPYCGWNINEGTCTTAPNKKPHESYWIQEVMNCPVRTDPIDGGWSHWSKWSPCRQEGGDDYCQCRRRQCDSPMPSRGGQACAGDDTEVCNTAEEKPVCLLICLFHLFFC